jgi:hypothetical protein
MRHIQGRVLAMRFRKRHQSKTTSKRPKETDMGRRQTWRKTHSATEVKVPDGGDRLVKRAQKERPCSECEQRAKRRCTDNEVVDEELTRRPDAEAARDGGSNRKRRRTEKRERAGRPLWLLLVLFPSRWRRTLTFERAHTQTKAFGAAGRERRGARAHSSGQSVT